MKVEYLRHKSGRQFARVEGENVLRVLNKGDRTEVIIEKSKMMANAIIEDSQTYIPCTEQEFNSAYQEALERIQNMKIL